MSGLLVPVIGLFYRKLTDRYVALEAAGMKRAAESSQPASGVTRLPDDKTAP